MLIFCSEIHQYLIILLYNIFLLCEVFKWYSAFVYLSENIKYQIFLLLSGIVYTLNMLDNNERGILINYQEVLNCIIMREALMGRNS